MATTRSGWCMTKQHEGCPSKFTSSLTLKEAYCSCSCHIKPAPDIIRGKTSAG
jgi:hypothetical protein